MWKNTTSTSAPVAGTFDAALRLRSVGTDDIDVELVQGPAELGHAVTPGRPDLVHPERRVLIRVEYDRLAIALQIGASRQNNQSSIPSLQSASASNGWSHRR